MDLKHYDGAPSIAKILVAGGFGAGRPPWSARSARSARCAPRSGSATLGRRSTTPRVEAKPTTTVAMDFGRIDLRPGLALYLFGTPGQDRFWFVWDELALGALGALVLADTRRLADCFPSVDFFEQRGIPFVVAVNCFEGTEVFAVEDVRVALDLDPGVPVLLCDARERDSVKQVLVSLVRYVMSGNRRGEPDQHGLRGLGGVSLTGNLAGGTIGPNGWHADMHGHSNR